MLILEVALGVALGLWLVPFVPGLLKLSVKLAQIAGALVALGAAVGFFWSRPDVAGCLFVVWAFATFVWVICNY